MNDFKIGSLIVAGIFLAAVWAYNWWQEYRSRQRANKAFAGNQPDVLLNTPKNMVRKGDRMEPRLDEHESAERPETADYSADMPDDIPDLPPSYRPKYVEKAIEERHEEEYTPDEPQHEPHYAEDRYADEDDIPMPQAPIQPAASPRISQPAPVAAKVPPRAVQVDQEEEATEVMLANSLLDPSLDFIAEIHSESAISAGLVPPFAGNKRMQVIGLNPQSQWEVVTSAGRNRYHELKVGLQLADRQGALSQESLNAFCMSVQQFADENEATVTFPQRSAKLSTARELDDFCASVDVLIGLNLPAQQRPIPMEKVRIHAEQAGLVRSGDGTFQYRSESGKVLFVLANMDQTPLMSTSQGLTLLFDVPRVAGGLTVFDYLADFALHLAQALNLTLVDDNGKPLNATSIASIRKQLAGLYARMDDRGIVPGSVAALRLFA